MVKQTKAPVKKTTPATKKAPATTKKTNVKKVAEAAPAPAPVPEPTPAPVIEEVPKIFPTTEPKVKKSKKNNGRYRRYKVYYDNQIMNAKPYGFQPKQAAKKALTSILKFKLAELKKTNPEATMNDPSIINTPINFCIVQSSKNKLSTQTKNRITQIHYYRGERKHIKDNIGNYSNTANTEIVYDNDGNIDCIKVSHVFKNKEGKEEIKEIKYRYTNVVHKYKKSELNEHPELIITCEEIEKINARNKKIKMERMKKKGKKTKSEKKTEKKQKKEKTVKKNKKNCKKNKRVKKDKQQEPVQEVKTEQ